jgi:hypothetical protein
VKDSGVPAKHEEGYDLTMSGIKTCRTCHAEMPNMKLTGRSFVYGGGDINWKTENSWRTQ